MQGEFTQTGPKGNVSRGVFYLQKPGKMRFEYASPNPFVIVSDGNWVTIKNRSKDKADQYPLSQTPLRLVLIRPRQHSKEAKILGVSRTPTQSITVTLEDRKNIVPGQLILVYDKAKQRPCSNGSSSMARAAGPPSLRTSGARCRARSRILQDRRQAGDHPGQEERPLKSLRPAGISSLWRACQAVARIASRTALQLVIDAY